MLAVDHVKRRQRIAEAAADVIAQEGLEAATIRRIAAEIGCSTAVVTHYFADKQQLLLWTYRAQAQQGFDRVDELNALNPADLVDALVKFSVIDDNSKRRWRVYIAFWDRAARDPLFAEEQRSHMDLALERIAGFIRAAYGDRADIDSISRVLNALVHGISLQAMVKPDTWPEEQIRKTLTHQIENVLGPAPTAS